MLFGWSFFCDRPFKKRRSRTRTGPAEICYGGERSRKKKKAAERPQLFPVSSPQDVMSAYKQQAVTVRRARRWAAGEESLGLQFLFQIRGDGMEREKAGVSRRCLEAGRQKGRKSGRDPDFPAWSLTSETNRGSSYRRRRSTVKRLNREGKKWIPQFSWNAFCAPCCARTTLY